MPTLSLLDKEEIIESIQELLDDVWDDILSEDITSFDLANDIAVLVLK